jgi:glycosyltransferase involved in cell wall biosynthesis
MQPIHIIGRFGSSTGGSERRAIELGRILKQYAPVHLWATDIPGVGFPNDVDITTINPYKGKLPLRGTFVFVGVYFHVGRWFHLSMPSRIIVILNTAQEKEFYELANTVAHGDLNKIDLVYASYSFRDMIKLPGIVQLSPIDTNLFKPQDSGTATQPFTIGRLSRDHQTKFHHDDPNLFLALNDLGIPVRIMGGKCLAPHLSENPLLTLLPEGAEPAHEFLLTISCFVYRTKMNFFETFGRVVFEAMACGIPVVCEASGGYADWIKHGVNGFLYHDNEEAIQYILALKNDPELRNTIGKNGRQTVEEMYSNKQRREIAEYYIGDEKVREIEYGNNIG